jgi:hypothetical protein
LFGVSVIAALADAAGIVLILTKHNCKIGPSNLSTITTAEDAAIIAGVLQRLIYDFLYLVLFCHEAM